MVVLQKDEGGQYVPFTTHETTIGREGLGQGIAVVMQYGQHNAAKELNGLGRKTTVFVD